MSNPKPVFPGGYDPPGFKPGTYQNTGSYYGDDHARQLLAGVGTRRQNHQGSLWNLSQDDRERGRTWDGDEYVGDIEYTDCLDCNGTGRNAFPELDVIDCPTCDGLGEVQVCTRCHGTGDSPSTKGVACARCEGNGIDPGTESGQVPQAKFQAPLPPPVPTWRNMPWTARQAEQAARSSNIFTKLYGQYRAMRENYYNCPEGRHWGPRGAAGLIPVVLVDGHPMVLLSHRSKFVEKGGTWSSFGGAIDAEDKSPFAAAIRETFEEVANLPKKGNVIGKIERPCHACGWTYYTFVVLVDAKPEDLLKVEVAKGASHWETEGVAWVPDWFVKHYPLHPGFEKSWPEVQAFITRAVYAARAKGGAK